MAKRRILQRVSGGDSRVYQASVQARNEALAAQQAAQQRAAEAQAAADQAGDAGAAAAEEVVAGGAGLMTFTPPGAGGLPRPALVRFNAFVTPEDYGAPGDGVTDATTPIRNAIAAAVANGVPLMVPPGKSYFLRQRVDLPSGLQFLGNPTSEFVISGADFTTTANSHGTNGVGILATERTGIHARYLRLRQRDMVSGRRVNGISIRRSNDVVLDQAEVWGANSGYPIGIDSCSGIRLLSPHAHDCMIVSDTLKQLTGICVDDNRLNGVSSSDIEIRSPRILNMLADDAFVAAHGYQTDGINIQRADRVQITDPYIYRCGEGLDLTGSRIAVTGGLIVESSDAAIKLVHGAQFVSVTGTQIYRAGYAGIVIGGTSSGGRPSSYNTFIGVVVGGIGWNGRWNHTERCALSISDQGAIWQAEYNRFMHCTSYEMTAASREIISNGTGLGNGFYDFVPSRDLSGTQVFTRNNPNTVISFALNSSGSQQVGGFTSSRRVAYLTEQGVLEQRFDDTSTVSPHIITAAGGTQIGHGAHIARLYAGRNGAAFDNTAAVQLTGSMTGDWSGTSTRSMRFLISCIQAGTLQTVAVFDPGGGTQLLLKMSDGSFRLAPVEIGAADSGGTGFRALRTPN